MFEILIASLAAGRCDALRCELARLWTAAYYPEPSRKPLDPVNAIIITSETITALCFGCQLSAC
jgi:hypothetical protein